MGEGLAVLAVQQIRRMRGGAQGQLMLGADGHIYVVKFQNNPQHIRVFANVLEPGNDAGRDCNSGRGLPAERCRDR